MAAVMFLRKAMRYYRLWIYTCNAVLLVSVIVFMGVGVGVASHPYLYLVAAPPAYHPTLLYGYVALLLQAGVLQALGCLGALRLSQRLLNIYWLLLLFLLLGDVVVGLVWLYRFSHLTEGLRPYAQATLRNQYGRDPDVTDAWDALQQAAQCCGALGPRDYNTTWWMGDPHRSGTTTTTTTTIHLPASCCVRNDTPHSSSRLTGTTSTQAGRDTSVQSDQAARHVVQPQRGKSSNMDTSKNHVHSGGGLRGGGGGGNSNTGQERNVTCAGPDHHHHYHHTRGCAPHLEKWLLKSAETLMILGFCVIAFVKLCFVGILRFEIQEMIQKIKILQGDAPCVPNPEIAAALGLVSPEKQAECGGLLSSGGDDAGGGNEGGGGGNGGGGGDSTQETESASATPLTQPRLNHLSGHTDGAESDTNSHCALITDTPVRRPQPDKRKPNGNNNDVTELRELRHVRQTQI